MTDDPDAPDDDGRDDPSISLPPKMLRGSKMPEVHVATFLRELVRRTAPPVPAKAFWVRANEPFQWFMGTGSIDLPVEIQVYAGLQEGEAHELLDRFNRTPWRRRTDPDGLEHKHLADRIIFWACVRIRPEDLAPA